MWGGGEERGLIRNNSLGMPSSSRQEDDGEEAAEELSDSDATVPISVIDADDEGDDEGDQEATAAKAPVDPAGSASLPRRRLHQHHQHQLHQHRIGG